MVQAIDVNQESQRPARSISTRDAGEHLVVAVHAAQGSEASCAPTNAPA